jgi:hypothetical protein
VISLVEYDLLAMAVVIVVMKVLFVLDDNWEK